MMKMLDAVRLLGSHLNMLPIESGMTLPIIALEDNKVLMRRLIYLTRLVPGEGKYITPPQMSGTVDLTDGKFVALEKLPVVDTPNTDQAAAANGRHEGPAFETPEQLIDTYFHLYSLYDVLVPAFVAGDRTAPSQQVQASAREFETLFDQLAEGPLIKAYETYGGRFFRFVHTVAAGDN